jgi:multidrug efflux pump subunit AcrA (membrane-fusion protein)
MNEIILGILAAASLGSGFLLWRTRQKAAALRERLGVLERYSGIADAKASLDEAKKQLEAFEAEQERRRSQLGREYEAGLKKYNNLNSEVALLEENLEDISYGLYKPHFTFQTSDQDKTALDKVRDDERLMIRKGQAAVCPTDWTVNASRREGERMVKQYNKVMLRAFNGECDAAVANVTWNNVDKMEMRVRKSFEAINNLGDVMKVSITPEYIALKIKELQLTHDYEEKRYQEKEEQRKIRERIREEEKAQREIEKAKEDAEAEEARYEKALEKARKEALQATGAQLEKLTEQVKAFEAKLDEARKHKERAVARAQLTKSGFVYIISNVGSFGDRIYKIGMTRRLEPMERIAELGDASVPFPFDLHAMLYSDNAPELEAALQQLVDKGRVNLVNPRKEFYEGVSLDEIETFVRSRGLSAQFIKVPEAREYRKTLAMRHQREDAAATHKKNEPEQVAADLFAA